jgi:hypothetical protein
MFRVGLHLLASACLLWCATSAFAYTLQNEEGGFRVDFPQPPKVDLKSYQTFTNHIWIVDSGARAFAVSMIVYERPLTSKPEDIMQTGLKGSGFVLRSYQPVTVDGISGLDFYADRPGAIAMRGRVFIQNTRMFQLHFIGPKGEELGPPADAYLKSFRFLRK